MATINPYLTFNGNCEEAFNFYKSVFGGEFRQISKFGDIQPPMPGHEMSEEEKKRNFCMFHCPLAKKPF